MKSKRDKYKKTIDLYEELGEDYIKDIDKVVPKEIYDFIKLLPKGGRVLDVGCAGGRDSKRFAEAGFKVIGIDLVDSFLKGAKKKVPQAKFLKMDLLNLKFPRNYFDAIWAHAVLLHVKKKDIPKALKHFHRILKLGGKIHIRVKQGKGTSYKREKLSRGKKRYFTYFLKGELENFIKKSGFKIISSKIFPDDLNRKNVKWIGIWAEK